MRWSTIVIIFSVFFGSAILSADGWGQAPRTPKIAFTSFRGGNDEIYVMHADGKNQRNLTNHPGGGYAPAWSPDGRRIAFYSSRPEGSGLYVMDADGKNQRYLTPVGQNNPPAEWSPDGKKMVFESSRKNGKADIYVMNADGTNRRRLTKHLAHDRYPAWSPDGEKIVFYSERETVFVEHLGLTPPLRSLCRPSVSVSLAGVK